MGISAKSARLRMALLSTALVTLAGCDTTGWDFDLRDSFGGFDTSGAVQQASAPRPQPDNRGVISYPNYQVAIARRGDTVGDVAARLGMDGAELAAFNGVDVNAPLRQDEVIALPRRVSEPSPATGATGTGPIRPAGQIDVETLASDAIERAEPAANNTPPASNPSQTGAEPVRHQVERGETAYSISRLYNVSVRSLADWNGLPSDLSVRAGQYLLIPVAAQSAAQSGDPVAPGQGTPTPTPPSASQPLPAESPLTASEIADSTPDSPDLAETRSDSARFVFPVEGNIIRPFDSGRSGGIDIAAPAGTNVVAADAGTVAAITQSTDDVPVLVLRHAGNLLTVYANVSDIQVENGDRVTRGQQIATVRAGDPSFIRFEVRRGIESVDPMDFLN